MTTIHPGAQPDLGAPRTSPGLADAAAAAADLTRDSMGPRSAQLPQIRTSTENPDRTMRLQMEDGRALGLQVHPSLLTLGAEELGAQLCDLMNEARDEHEVAVLDAASRVGAPDAIEAAQQVHQTIQAAFNAEIDAVLASVERQLEED